MIVHPTGHIPYPAIPQTNIDWKSTIPSYLSWLFSVHLNQINIFTLIFILLFTFILFLGLYVYLLYLRFKKQLSQQSVLLEIKPPAISLQSAFSTRQLFTILHSLDHKLTNLEKLLKVKRRTSFEIVSTREEGIRYLLYLPKEDVDVVTKNIRAYVPEVTIKEIPDYIPQKVQELSDKPFVIKELKFKHSYELPLQEQDILTQYDPIAYLTGHMTKLDPDEIVSLQVVTTPVTSATHGAMDEHIHLLKKRIENGQEIESEIYKNAFTDIFRVLGSLLNFVGHIAYETGTALGNWIMDFALATRRPAYQYPQVLRVKDELSKNEVKELTPRQKEMNDLAKKKLNQELFETTVRIFITSSSQKTITDRQTGIVGTLATFKNPSWQELKVKSQLPVSFDFLKKLDFLKLKHRLLAFSSNPILSISEISSLYHFPYTNTTQTEDLQLLRSYELPAPVSFKKANPNFDIIFAHNFHGGAVTPIGLELEQRFSHIYAIGQTGTGKSTLLEQMIYQDLVNGHGLALVDPHGDIADYLIGVTPKERLKDVVFWNPYDAKHPYGLNLLELPENLSETDMELERDLIISNIVSMFNKMYGEKYMGPRMEHVLKNTLLTALMLPHPTFRTVYRLLTDKDFRTYAQSKISDEFLLNFWKEEFNVLNANQRAEVITPITNKLSPFLTTSLVKNIICQKKSTINLDDIINNKKILICNLSKGKLTDDISFFLGNLIIAKMQLAVLRRAHIPPEERQPFFLYIDEFQNFATESFAQIFSEARKYKFGLIVVHQNEAQIKEKDLLDTITGNAGTMISFRIGPNDEKVILPFFSPQVKMGQMLHLPTLSFYIKINAKNPEDAFTGQISHFIIKFHPEIKQEVVENSQKTYGRDLKELKEEFTKDKEEEDRLVAGVTGTKSKSNKPNKPKNGKDKTVLEREKEK